MNNARQDFSIRAIAAIEDLAANFEIETENFSEDFRRQSARALHTIKGSSQVFGFPEAASLAHELENLLLAAAAVNPQISIEKNYKSLLAEGFRCLKKTFEQKDFGVSASFLAKLRKFAPPENKRRAEDFSEALPPEILSQLADGERKTIETATRAGRHLACLAVDFKRADFAAGLKKFRQDLQEKCEIIAVLPGAQTGAPDRIAFQILIAAQSENIERIAAENAAVIVFQNAANNNSDDSQNIFERVAAYGRALLKQLGKDAEFQIDADAFAKTEISPRVLEIVSDALPQLVRNAVDHAVEPPAERIAKNKKPRGTIKIGFSGAPDGFRVTVADDGRGIDAEKIKALAIEKKLISAAGKFSEKALFDLIFLPEFSAAERLTEISGRGVGLDAVKNAVERAGGTITVESRADVGATFEIFLPETV